MSLKLVTQGGVCGSIKLRYISIYKYMYIEALPVKAVLGHVCYESTVSHNLSHPPQSLSCRTAQNGVSAAQCTLKWFMFI